MLERINRAILSGLRYALQQHDLQPEVFKNLIHYIVLAWNTSVLSHLNFSPYQLFLSTPYEPAILTSFVTLQEADRDYGDFIAALVKTQHLVGNLVNERFQETRDKRYQKKNTHSKRHIMSPGMQVMIKVKQDNTQRAHKLRPRFKGPYKIVKEFENNVEVIDWSPTRKVQLLHKYHNEARNIPKFERFLISKDMVKPCNDVVFYFDDNLARRFYQEFWDLIRDVAPIRDIERLNRPTHFLDKTPRNRPSSLIIPANLGIKHPPRPTQIPQISTLAPLSSHSPTISSHPTFMSDEDDIIGEQGDIVLGGRVEGMVDTPLFKLVLPMIATLHFLILRRQSFHPQF